MPHPHQANSLDDGPPPRFSTPALLLKLILLPGSVVFVLVMIAVLVSWLTLSPGNVDSLVEGLGEEGNARWRAAVNLAGVLRDPKNQALKEDPVLAGRLAEILRREIDSGRMGADSVTLRTYLCRALGEFRVRDPLPVLIEAAKTRRDVREVDVRRSAIEAIAVLAWNVGPAELRSHEPLIPLLHEAAEDEHAPVRSAAAFTLGVLGGDEAEAKLETLLSDGYPDVRYNAATGLARHGNPKAVDVLLEMLDPNEPAGIDVENQPSVREAKRAMILVNALRATGQLAAANPTADGRRLAEPVGRLSRADVPRHVRVKAVEVFDQLQHRAPEGQGAR